LSSQDEFVRPPRWMFILWASIKQRTVSVQHMILVSPYEANILVPLLRTSKLSNATLQRYAPRTRRDQFELLTSHLTFWPGSEPFLSTNDLQIHLKMAVMTMTMFGCSTCLQSKPHIGRSMAEFCLFLNVLPPPDICPVGIDNLDWNILLEDGWINSEGFLVHSSADVERSRLSESGRQFVRRMYAERKWKRSAVAAVRGLVPLRNMSAFFQRSDLESILFSK
jgi:hypothetical protein